MKTTFLVGAAALIACAGSAMAQTTLYGVDFGGGFYRINTTTGAATLIGATGFTRLNAAAADSQGRVYAWRGHNPTSTTDVDQLIQINPATGVGTLVFSYPSTADMRGIAFGSGDVLYGIRDNSQPPNPNPSAIDDLVTVDMTTGAITLVGPTSFTDIQGLTSAPGGALFGNGVGGSGTLYRLDPGTGATVVVATGIGTAIQSLEWASGTTAWGGRVSLFTVDLVTGAVSTVGTLGATADLRGMAAVRTCYPNCDNSTTPPILNVQDFGCFLNRFAAGCT